MKEVERLAQSRRGYLVAPAGCGKTHLIAQAVAHYRQGRELILTHTHAGVDAMRGRLKEMNAPSAASQVETIAGWALRYAAAFPSISGLETAKPTGDDWDKVYQGAVRLLRNSPIGQVVRSSYSGVYVDEYQDCTTIQHELVLELAKLLPCRILGDPLQGIFDFGDNILVDWEHDVATSFEQLPELTKPWRWHEKHSELGVWLQEVRSSLLSGCEIDLRQSPAEWKKLPQKSTASAQIASCFEVARANEGSVVAIYKWPQECHKVASCLRGVFTCVEPIDCEDLMTRAYKIQSAMGTARAAEVIDFAACCMTQIKTQLRSLRQAFLEGRLPSVRRIKHKEQLIYLMRVAKEDSLAFVLPALETLRTIPGAVLYRKELFDEMRRALREFDNGSYPSLQDAAWLVRNRTRQRGRSLGRCTVGRTLLIKGLEFDHAIVLDADAFNAKNLYVAMTRGSRSLTVFSKRPTIRPS